MCLACWLCLEHGGTRQCRGEGTAVGAAGTGGIVLQQMVPVHVGCHPTVRRLRLPQRQEKAVSLLTCSPRELLTWAKRKVSREHRAIHKPTQVQSDTWFCPFSWDPVMTLCRAGHCPRSTSSSDKDGGYSPSPVSA